METERIFGSWLAAILLAMVVGCDMQHTGAFKPRQPPQNRRDALAAQVMAEELRKGRIVDPDRLSRYSYAVADAMLESGGE